MIELATVDHRAELLALKARTRARIDSRVAHVFESEPYEAHNLVVRYIVRYRKQLTRSGWKGMFYVGWRPVGENQICGWLEDIENGSRRFVPAWIKAQVDGGGHAGLGDALEAPAVHRAGADVDATMAACRGAEGPAVSSPVPD